MTRWPFRLLLRAYPAWFRESHGTELVEFWMTQAGEPRYRGLRGRIRYALSLVADTTVAAARLRLRRRPAPATGYGSATRRDPLIGSVLVEVRSSWRSLVRAPLFTAMAVATLALGIGATTAVYSVVSAVLLRPLPYPEPERLVLIPRTAAANQSVDLSWPDFADWRQQSTGFLSIAGYAEAESSFEWEDGAESLPGALVTRNYFEVMSVVPLRGRTFSAEEDRYHGPDAIIISHDLWQRRFGGAETAIGQTVPLAGAAVQIVGVMPAGFEAPFAGQSFWQPLQEEELLERAGLPTGARTLNFVSAVGRLGTGVTRAAAEGQLRAVAAGIDASTGRLADQRADPRLVPLREAMVGDAASMIRLLMAAAALVLVVAAANVAGLALSRAAGRQRELTMRNVLGADRGRLMRQALTEGMLLVALAGAAGVVIAAGLLQVLIRLAPSGLPRLGSIGLTPATIGFAATVSVVTGLLLGLLSSIGTPDRSLASRLAGGRGTSVGAAGLRPQHLLVTLQVAVSVALLAAAGLLTHSFARLSRVDLGFDGEAVVLATIAPPESRYATPAALDGLYASLLEQVRALPGVTAASTTYSPPLVGNTFRTSVAPDQVEEDRANRIFAGTVIVGDRYFEANGIPIEAGRSFDGTERLGGPLVAVVSQSMAQRLWPGETPVGREFRFTGGMSGSIDSFDRAFFPNQPLTVIGVARDVYREGPAAGPSLEYYRPHSQIPWGFQYLVVRTASDPAALAAALRTAVWAIDPTIPVRTVRTLRSHLDEAIAAPRFRTLLVSGFAGLAGLLAMVGLYAVMTLAVTRRTREMGIRIALGASRDSVVRGVMRGGLRLVAVGAGLGLATALLSGRVLSSMLFDLEPTDPATYVAVTAVVGLVAAIACYGPARRAGRVDPVQSLQDE